MSSSATARIELEMRDLENILQRTGGVLPPEDQEKLQLLLDAYQTLTGLIGEQGTTIHSLRRALGLPNPKSEATRDVCPPSAEASPPTPPPAPKPRAPGHGRNGAEDFPAAKREAVPHESLGAGNPCPGCSLGKLYAVKTPGVLIRIHATPPFQARIYELAKLRCNACGEVFTAAPPLGVGSDKFDATARAMIALLKYGSGFPFYRLERLQHSLGIPLPASTQWDEVNRLAVDIETVVEELIRQAAHGEVLHNDDTSMRVLSLAKERNLAEEKKRKRTGIFTTGIVSIVVGRHIALFITGGQHAGENLADVLAKRAADLAAPLQMCDALDRNMPKDFQVLLGNCLAHGRRHFVPLAGSFPDEVRHVLEQFRQVYIHDATTKAMGLSPTARLAYHQENSGPVMDGLLEWLVGQFDDKRIEPNSRLGDAAQYLIDHWIPLTLFLREPGAPLDNNLCERALKRAILHRKNSLFYKTLRGAAVGDAFMSIIHTCELNAVNPFTYLVALQEHASVVAQDPAAWLPWNFHTCSTPKQVRSPF